MVGEAGQKAWQGNVSQEAASALRSKVPFLYQGRWAQQGEEEIVVTRLVQAKQRNDSIF